MADFAHFGEAVCQGLGYAPGAFLAAYNRDRRAADKSVLDDSPVARTMKALMTDGRAWTGTASELLVDLTSGPSRATQPGNNPT
jgi:hypothetical protein